MPKYSIILPVYNACDYIQTAIDSVLSQKYQDFEFIISNNCSTDGTELILSKIIDPRVKIIKPENPLPLGAHWNFALKHAAGEWLWAMGADDAMVPYFFELCDKLIEICEQKKLKIIKSNRAYYFWPGCESNYGNAHIDYNLSTSIKIKKTFTIMKDMLTGHAAYIDVPQMYVSSLFSRELLKRAETLSKTNELIPYDVPAQDAYLGVLACILERQYLFVNIPLGWVGTSPANMENKVKTKQIFYEDCSYSKLGSKVQSLIFIMHLAFRAFFENTTHADKKISKYTKYDSILARAFYCDLRKLDGNDSRVLAFYGYLERMGIDKKKFLKKVGQIERREKFLKLFTGNRAILLLEKCVEKIFSIASKEWGISISNKSFLSYRQINLLLESEFHVQRVLNKYSQKMDMRS